MFCPMKAMLVLAATLTAWTVSGDQVDMKNGDRYTGRVLTVSPDSVVLQNDIIGKVTLPRAQVAVLSIGAPTPNGAVPATTNAMAAPLKPNADLHGNDEIASALKQLGANTNFIAKVKGQFLGDAGPEANQKFDETLAGLTSGNIDMAGLRAQAKSAADELRKYQKDAGPEGETMNTYLAILDNFLNETAGVTSSTNR